MNARQFITTVIAATLYAAAATDARGATYTFKSVKGNWNTASAWVDGVVPPNDGTADVVFICTNAAFTVTVDTTRRVRSLTLSGSSNASKAITFTGGKLSIGAGGLQYDSAATYAGAQINSGVIIETSQNWLLTTINNGGNFLLYSTVTMDATDANDVPIVWTIAGKSTLYTHDNFKGSGIKGTVRLNRSSSTYGENTFANQLASPAKLVLFDSSDPTAGTSSITLTAFDSSKVSTLLTRISSPIEIAASSAKITFSLPCSEYLDKASYRYRATSAFTGTIDDKQLTFIGPGKIKAHDFANQTILLNDDASGLSAAQGVANPAICLAGGLFTLGSANALGTGNAFNVRLSGSTGGFLAGLLATDGVNAASDIEITPVSTFAVLGMAGAGETTFSGDVATSGLASNSRIGLLLEAGEGAVVRFTGDFNLSNTYDSPVRVCGGGDIHLDGDNAHVLKSIRINSARLYTGSDTALGTKPVSVGYAQPTSTTVKAVCNMGWYYIGGSWQKYFKSNSGTTLSYTGTLPAFDGVTLAVGDTFLYAPAHETGNIRIWKVIEGNKVALEQQYPYTEGMTVAVEQGTFYGGKTFRYLGTNVAIPDAADLDVALLAKGGRVITNDIAVAANGSAGASIIGCSDATDNTFSGAISLNRDVTFQAAAGGTVRVTGSITDANGEANAFAFNGTGTVALPSGTDMNGRTVSFPDLSDAALDATGSPVCTLVTAADGLTVADIAAPSLSKWQLRVKPTSIRAVKNIGTKIMMQ